MANLSLGMDDNTCSLMRLSGWGGQTPTGYSKKYGYRECTNSVDSLADFLKQFRNLVDRHNNREDSANYFRRQGLLMTTVITTQTKALEVLEQFGGWSITQSNKMPKYNHEVLLLAIPVRDFVERFNDHSKSLKLGLSLQYDDKASETPTDDDDE
jgi:hypothetical protein